jgi:hypothetical protein
MITDILFICTLFNITFSLTQDYIASNEGVINECEMERIWKEVA